MKQVTVPTIVIDSREKHPYTFTEGFPTVRKKLDAGDYSIVGAEGRFAIERKSLSDFVSTIIHCKVRWYNEMERLRSYDAAYIIVEANLPDIYAGTYRSKANPKSVVGLALALMRDYRIPILFCGDRTSGRRIVEWFAVDFAKRLVKTFLAT